MLTLLLLFGDLLVFHICPDEGILPYLAVSPLIELELRGDETQWLAVKCKVSGLLVTSEVKSITQNSFFCVALPKEVAEQNSGIGTISDTIVIFLWSYLMWLVTVKSKVDLPGQSHVKLPWITRWARKSSCISVDAGARNVNDHNGTFSDFLSQFDDNYPWVSFCIG